MRVPDITRPRPRENSSTLPIDSVLPSQRCYHSYLTPSPHHPRDTHPALPISSKSKLPRVQLNYTHKFRPPDCTKTAIYQLINQSMGNHISCVSAGANPPKMVKILHLSCGSVQEFEGPMKAAEVMLENPQHFVCDCDVLQMGRRIAALPADHDLIIGHTYFLISMPKLHSQVSPAEMAFLAAQISHSNDKRRGSNTAAKILPLFGDSWELMPAKSNGGVSKPQGDLQKAPTTPEFVVPKLHLDGLPELYLACGKQKLSRCRNWKTVLATISESPRLLQS